jgi:hypothetical protein
LRPTPKWLFIFLMLVGLSFACNFTQTTVTQVVTVEVTAGSTSQVEAVATSTSSATPTLAPSPTDSPVASPTVTATVFPSPTTGPECTVLKRVNLREGPGTAYYKNVVSLDVGTVLLPIAYNPVGNPDGDWVQVNIPATNQKGWVSAAADLINCTISLIPLPTASVQPPPPPLLPAVSYSVIMPPVNTTVDFSLDTSPNYLIRALARLKGESNDGDGIDHVVFAVYKDNNIIYTTTEKTAKYCIFNGGEPSCNSWPKYNGQYAWSSNGPELESGDYWVAIRVADKNDPIVEYEWDFTITIQLP